MFDLSCVLFAGGKSSRMGRDKSLLPFGGYPTLAQYQYSRLNHLFPDVYLSAKSAEKFDFNPNVIVDPPHADFAPTAGFVAAFEALRDERIFVLSVDAPFVDESVISALLRADAPHLDAIIAKTPSGTHPMCGIYHRSLLEPFQHMLTHSDHRLGKLLSVANTQFVEFSEETLFANVNNPDEYEEALRRHVEIASLL